MLHFIRAGGGRTTLAAFALFCLGAWLYQNFERANGSPRAEARAKEIEAVLKRIRLPDGFSIGLYALGARRP